MTLFINNDVVAKVLTMDDSQPTAQAVAVGQDHIVAVGETADIQRLAGPDTQVIDGEGRQVSDQEGELAITALDNYAMPMIRYRIGDLAARPLFGVFAIHLNNIHTDIKTHN